MKIKIALYLCFINCYLNLHSQVVFEKMLGGNKQDMIEKVIAMSDGGYVFLGQTDSYGAGAWDIQLIRLNENGDTLWTKTYGWESSELATSIKQTSDGGFIILGSSDRVLNSYESVIFKTNQFGDILWTKIIEDIKYSATNIVQTKDGNYLLVGETNDYPVIENSILLKKLDTQGNCLWTKSYNNNATFYPTDVLETSNGLIYIVANIFKTTYLTPTSYYTDFPYPYLIKTNCLGDTIMTKVYADKAQQSFFLRNAQISSDGGVILCGGLPNSNNNGNLDYNLIKLDTIGNILWSKTYGSGEQDDAREVQQTNDKGYIIAGYTHYSNTNKVKFYLVKTDSLGNEVWEKVFGNSTSSSYAAFSVKQTKDNGFILAGYTYDSYGQINDYIIKTDSKGCLIPKKLIFGNEFLCMNTESILYTPTTLSRFSYMWSDKSTNPYLLINHAGSYSVLFTDENGCQKADTLIVKEVKKPNINLGRDTTLLSGEIIVLKAGSNYQSYLWSDNSSSDSLLINSSTLDVGQKTYWVNVNNYGCFGQDSILITIKQKPDPQMSLSTSTLNVPSNDKSNLSFYITSNSSWTVSSNQSWLTVGTASGSGNETVTLTVQGNPTTLARTAVVTVSGTGVITQTVIVTQDGAASVLNVSSNMLTISAPSNSTKTFDVTSNTNWAALSNQTWLTVGTASGSGNETVTLTAQGNPTTATRTATVAVSGTGVVTQNVTVTQDGGTTGLGEEKNFNISIFPIPAVTSFFIIGLTQNQKISISDLAGKILLFKYITKDEIDVSNFVKGVYFIKIADKNSIITKKFIKQ